jgi:ribosome biogenesis GTPase
LSLPDQSPQNSTVVLDEIGWSEFFHTEFQPWADRGFQPGRVSRMDGPSGLVMMPEGIKRAEPSRELLDSLDLASTPAVGDWVAVQARPRHDTALIEGVLPRRSALIRRRSSRREGEAAEAQVLAANVDIVFIVALAPEPNLRRIEREVAQIWESGADPVVVLTKRDLSQDPEAAASSVAAVAPGVPIHVVNGRSGEGVEAIGAYAAGNRTLVLIGASGVGKSTLANQLLGEEILATGAVRETDGRGRHTTTARHLLPLPGGGALIDTPGLRSFALYDADEGVSRAFTDVEAFAGDCRFRDCGHQNEPGCAVRQAVADGALEAARLDGYLVLARELGYEATKLDKEAELARKQEQRRFGRVVRRGAKKHRAAKEGRRPT